MFVLGFDPGLSRCGYGCVEHGRRPRAVAAGVIRTDPALDRPVRLAELQREIRALIAELSPEVVAVERVLFQRNVATAMGVGMASGLLLAEGAAAGCSVVEYSPNEVKEAVAGWGGADKDEVGRMVQTLLDLPQQLRPADAADAVAVALCHLARQPARRDSRARVAGTSVGGTSAGGTTRTGVAGTSVARTGVARTDVDGTSVDGTSVPGTGVGGTSVGGTGVDGTAS